MDKQGIFVVSLDFELHWGRLDKIELTEDVMKRLSNTQKIIPEKLTLFEANDIHATWATVGMLFNHSAQDWMQNKPLHADNFLKNVSPHYRIGETESFRSDEHVDFYFAPQLVKLITKTKGQELATHTYGHYCYFDHGCNRDELRNDLLAAKKMAASQGIELQSLVFPRNQYDQSSLAICEEAGISIVRTNPPVWYWNAINGNSVIKKIFRTADTFNLFNFSKVYRTDDILKQNTQNLFCLPASRLYKPWKKENSMFNRVKLNRIKYEMTAAAKSNSYYHLWWHPENFGDNPVECMQELREIVIHFNKLRSKYRFASFTMKEAADYIKSLNECRC